MPKIKRKLKKIRKKRFLVNDNLPNFYSNKNEIIHLAYDFSEESILDLDYVEQVKIASEEFNAYNFAKLTYRPVSTTNLTMNSSIDELALRKKHLNQIVFGQFNSSSNFLLATTWVIYSFDNYINFLKKINSTMDSWSAFAWIDANTANPKYQSNPVGILLHEIYHLFGIKDLYRLPIDCWNGILYTNISAILECKTIKNSVNSNCSKVDFLKNIEPGACSALSEDLIISPISLFSLHQYTRKTLEPIYLINETRIIELLKEKNFTVDLQKDYFELLGKYQGYNHFATYQDISALVKSIYLSAPDSLWGQNFNTPNYYSVKAVYRPLADEEKFNRLIAFFKQSENFNYPILAQESLNLSVDTGDTQVINLVEKFKVVNLTPQRIRCYIEKPTPLTAILQLSEECILKLYSQTDVIYRVNITLKTNSTVINRYIQLFFSKKPRLMDTLILENPSVVFKLSKSSRIIDLIDLCRAITMSQQNDLQCISSDLPKDLLFFNCSVSGMDHNKSYIFTVNFSNQLINKTCKLHFLAFNRSVRNNNQNHGVALNYVLEGPYVFNDTRPLTYENILPMPSHLDPSDSLTNPIIGRYKQLNYLLTFPLLHGAFEGCIDAMSLNSGIKLICKTVSSLLLVSMNYFSKLQFPFLFFYYLIEFSLNKNLATSHRKIIHDFQLILFLIVTELEYGFCNLWFLADKPIFLSALNEHINNFFIQMLWMPLIKTTGYLLSSFMIDFMSQLSNGKIRNDASTNTKLNNIPQLGGASFFNSLKIMKNTVSFKNIKRLPNMFYKQHDLPNKENTTHFLHNLN